MINSRQLFPDLESERFYLRQLTDNDVDFIFKHFSDPSVTEYLMDAPPVSAMPEAQAIIDLFKNPESKTQNRWGIITKSDNHIIGTIGYHKWYKSYYHAEIGFDLVQQYWGQGVMDEVARIVIGFGFESMGLNRINGLVYVENERCLRLTQKLGFTIEGRLKDYFCLNNKFYDHFILALLKREWKN